MIQREMISKLIPLILDAHDKIVAYLEDGKTRPLTDKTIRNRRGAMKNIGAEFYDDVLKNGMTIDSECTKEDMGEIVFRSAYNVANGQNPADFVGLMIQELDCHSDIHN